jgi:hypothetical protein
VARWLLVAGSPGRPCGPWLLAVVTLGLAAFGAYSIAEARWL